MARDWYLSDPRHKVVLTAYESLEVQMQGYVKGDLVYHVTDKSMNNVREIILEVGDEVRYGNLVGIIGEVNGNDLYIWSNNIEFRGSQGLLSPQTRGFQYSWITSRFDGVELLKKANNKTIMSVVKRFIESLASEPKKSLRKYGIINSDGELTSEGITVLLNWLFNKEDIQKEFFTTVIQPMVDEDAKKKD